MDGLLGFITLLVVGFIIYLQYELRLLYSEIKWYRETNESLHRAINEPRSISSWPVNPYPVEDPLDKEIQGVKAEIAQLEKVVKQLE